MAVEPLLATRAQRAFILTVILHDLYALEAIVVLIMVGITFRKVDVEVDFHIPRIFELFIAFDALRLRNVIQLLGLLLFHLALMVFAALQVHQTRTALVQLPNCDGTRSFLVSIILFLQWFVIGASWLVMLFWIKQLYGEFGWAIFHVVGADRKMKTMYQWYQIMICLLKFDFFCFTGVTMQLLILVLQKNSAEFGVTIAAIPIVLVLLILCGVAVQREIKWIMSISFVMMLAALTYFLYKLVRFYEPSSRSQYETTRATLTTFTIVAFLLLFATLVVGLRCFVDFDKGLLASKVNSERVSLPLFRGMI
ncbi:UPF0658 Golgi apparatus membrane protein [Termitomyces sp. J132]|nr:UPF0658 Golgi apparatus membrane protein [Termitomyces sp. J132]